MSSTGGGPSGTASAPASWFREQAIYDLERRCLFTRSWLLVTHKSRFADPGDYILFEIAGYSFFVIMGKDKSLRAFHNVCRHRAFPVVKKQSGSSLILGCKYHGWCYDTTGALTKAPQFDTVSGFDPAQNALFPIALHLDEPSGLVFVCMDNGRNGDVPSFSEFFGELDGSLPNLAEFTHYADYSVEGDLNWKSKSPDADSGLLGTHSIKFTPRTPGPEPLKQSDGPSLNGGLMKSLGLGASSNPNRSPTSPASGIFFYPNATLSIHSTGFYISRSNPLGPTKSSINCEIYVTKGATKEDSDSFLDFVKSSERSSVEASSALQAGLVEGSAVPRTGMLAFKDEAKKTLEKWAAMEKERGRDINAAGFEGEDEEEDGIVEKICSLGRKELVW